MRAPWRTSQALSELGRRLQETAASTMIHSVHDLGNAPALRPLGEPWLGNASKGVITEGKDEIWEDNHCLCRNVLHGPQFIAVTAVDRRTLASQRKAPDIDTPRMFQEYFHIRPKSMVSCACAAA